MYFKQLYIQEAVNRPVSQAYCTRLFRSLPLVERLQSQVTVEGDTSWEARLVYWGRGRSHQPRAHCVNGADRAEALLKRDNLAT